MKTKLTGAQWRVLLWVMRQTLGWRRAWTPFTWYRISKDTGMDRAAAYRAGHALLARGLLMAGHNQLKLSVVWEQRYALSPNNADVVSAQRDRCQDATLFRRVKDSLKENIKEKEEERSKNDDGRHRSTEGCDKRTGLLAGAAAPIPGKYDCL